jgi:hypothetical protein
MESPQKQFGLSLGLARRLFSLVRERYTGFYAIEQCLPLPPAPEHRKEMHRLQRELAKAGVDYSQHKEQCAVCKRG